MTDKLHRFSTSTSRHAFIAGVAALLLSNAAEAAPKVEKRSVEGLAKAAEIRVDRWGIAHIYADSVRDAFFLQGYNAARDRLWQIDLWRKRGLGLLARDFGPSYVAQDRAARLFLYRGDMAREWAAYGHDAKNHTEAFVAGVNAYVREILSGQRPMPIEFTIAGTKPDLWRADEVVRIRSHGLTRNVASEVARAQVACKADLAADQLRQSFKPSWKTKVPAGLDPCSIPAEVLNDYTLGTSGVRFDALAADRRIALDSVGADAVGSNNWVIAPKRSATGRPILANDPHRELSLPSLRYIVHLEAPGLSVIGAGEPALPGISIGHNGTIAFGLTIFAADQEDLYVYETDPNDPDRYRYGDGWEKMTVLREPVAVKGGEARLVELRFTRHGPVLYVDRAKNRAYALRTIWNEPGTSAYFGSTRYMGAKDWAGFNRAMNGWGAPSENQVYADTSGHIGWLAAGRVPVRANWDGLLPVPGDGRYEWKGFLATDQLPSAYDPARGWLASANEMNLPADYPVAERKVGFEWSNGARMARISEVLDKKSRMTLADAMALQTDPTNVVARRLVPLLTPLKNADPDLGPAIGLLEGWNGETSVDSAAAALFEVWAMKHLGRTAAARAVPESVRDLVGSGEFEAVVMLMERPDGRLGNDPAAARDRILLDSLKAALAEVRDRLGPDMAQWTWGKLHHARFVHALQPLASGAARAQLFSTERTPLPGTFLSPLAAGWMPNDFRTAAGASFRMVLDVGAWDESKVINTPGQSGDPSSPHYQDLYPLWAAGKYVPLLYSYKAVKRATSSILRLRPQR